jgi:hypothetical protein
MLIDYKVNEVRMHVKILAKNIKKVLDLSYSLTFLETIYTPIVAQLDYFKDEEKFYNCNLYFKCFVEVYDYFVGEEAKTNRYFEREIIWEKGNFDLITFQDLNIYEKIVFSVFRIKFKELKYTQPKEKERFEINFKLRNYLRTEIKKEKNYFLLNTIDFLPYSLLEGLEKKIHKENFPVSKMHLLGQIHNENYLIYLAHLKEKGTYVIGEPHGGGYSQVIPPFGNEIAEIILSDKYQRPNWLIDIKSFSDIYLLN